MSASTEETDCNEIKAMLPAYALGALEPNERTLVDQHLATCASCRAEAASYSGVVDALGVAAPRESPPAALRARVLSAASEPATSNAVPTPVPRPMPTPADPSPWARRAIFMLAAAAIFLLVSVFALAVLLERTIDKRDEAVAAERLMAEYAGADGRAIAMTSLAASNYGFSQGRGTILTAPGKPTVVLVGGCPPTSNSRVYRVWVALAGDRTGVGELKVDDKGWGWLAFEPSAELGQFDEIGVTMVTDGSERNDLLVAPV